MSVLVVGLSFRTAAIRLLERASLDAAARLLLESDLLDRDQVSEAVVVSTCNRLEVYADVAKFHAGVSEVTQCLAAATGLGRGELTEHLYVRYEDAAVAHLFSVVCGLDSMAVGEQQILGQVRSALRAAQDGGSVGRVLGALLPQALRVGKRVHSETGLDRAAVSLVESGLGRAAPVVGPLTDAQVLVVGAGAMSGLAVACARRAGAAQLVVCNRTLERGRRLAESAGGRHVAFADLAAALADADVVVSCTGAAGHVITAALAASALADRAARPQVYLDLALPRDVDPAVADLPGAHLIDLEGLGHHLASGPVGAQEGAEVAAARELVAEEVAAFLAAQRAEAVAPTVIALRAHARAVVDAELGRLQARVGDLDPRVLAELEQCVHRVVGKLLHTPTVRVKELAEAPGGSVYAQALSELFGLDLERVAAISAVESVPDTLGRAANESDPPTVSTLEAVGPPLTVPVAGGGAS